MRERFNRRSAPKRFGLTDRIGGNRGLRRFGRAFQSSTPGYPRHIFRYHLGTGFVRRDDLGGRRRHFDGVYLGLIDRCRLHHDFRNDWCHDRRLHGGFRGRYQCRAHSDGGSGNRFGLGRSRFLQIRFRRRGFAHQRLRANANCRNSRGSRRVSRRHGRSGSLSHHPFRLPFQNGDLSGRSTRGGDIVLPTHGTLTTGGGR